MRIALWLLLGVSGAAVLVTLYPIRKRSIAGFVRDGSVELEGEPEWE